MWYLIQGAIIVGVVAFLDGKTPNKVLIGMLAVGAAYAVTWIIFRIRQLSSRDRRLRKNF